jgi:hypothetical protein
MGITGWTFRLKYVSFLILFATFASAQQPSSPAAGEAPPEHDATALAKTTQNPAGDPKVVNNERSRRVKNLSPLSLDQKSHENDSKAGGRIPLRRMTASFEKPRMSGAAAALR